MIDLAAADGHAESALHQAAWAGDIDEVLRLIARGVDVNWRDSIGETALFGAVAWRRSEVSKVLLEAGADPNATNADGWSPMHWAASHGGPSMIQLLLAYGAIATIRDVSGRDPLDVAKQYRRNDTVAFLKAVARGK